MSASTLECIRNNIVTILHVLLLSMIMAELILTASSLIFQNLSDQVYVDLYHHVF